jgi:hypothetical protein
MGLLRSHHKITAINFHISADKFEKVNHMNVKLRILLSSLPKTFIGPTKREKLGAKVN